MPDDIILASSTTVSPPPPTAITQIADATILSGQLSPASVAVYRRDFKAYLLFAGSPAAALDPATLARFRVHLANDTKLSPNTINRQISAVKRLMTEAATQGYIAHELAEAFSRVGGVKVVAMKDRIKQYARTKIRPRDMRRLCSAPDEATTIGVRDRALLATMASTGLRITEVATLTMGQVLQRDGGHVVSIRGKNDVDFREVSLSREAYQLIMQWVGLRSVASQWMFTSWEGWGEGRATDGPMAIPSVWRIIQAYANKVGLEHIKPHDFRRFVGTQLAPKNLRQAQKVLGHKQINTTAKQYILDEVKVGITDDLYS